ncbi:MAG: chromosome segregation ATPase, partial [Kiritimatiellia bacterium]
ATQTESTNRIKSLMGGLDALSKDAATKVASQEQVIQGLDMQLEQAKAQSGEMQAQLASTDARVKQATVGMQIQLKVKDAALQVSQSEQTRVQGELTALKNAYRQDLDAKDQILQQAQNQLILANQQVKELQAGMSNNDALSKDLARKTESQEKELLRLQTEYEKSLTQLSALTVANRKHDAELKIQVAQATRPLEAQVQQLEAEKAQIALHLNKMRTDKTDDEKEKVGLIVRLQRDLEETTRTVITLKKKLSDSADLEMKAADYQKAHQIAAAQVQKMQEQLTSAGEQIQEASGMAQRAKNEKESAMAQLELTMKEVQTLKTQPKMTAQQKAQLTAMEKEAASLNKIRADLETKLTVREQEYAVLKASNEELSKAFNHAQEQMVVSRTKESAELERLKEQNTFMKGSLEEALKISSESKSQVDKLATDMNSLNAEHLALLKENTEMKSFASLSDTKIQSALDEKKKLEILQRQATQELDAMTLKYGELVRKDRANAEAAEQLKAMQQSVATTKEQLNRRDVEIQRLQGHMADTVAKGKAEADSLTARINSIDQQYNAKLTSKDSDYAKLMQMISSKGLEDQSTKAALTKATEESAALKDAIKAKDRDLAKMKAGGKQVTELETQLAQLQQNVKATQAQALNEKDQLMAQLQARENENRQLQTAVTRMSANPNPDVLAQKTQEIALLKASNREQLTAMQEKVSALQAAVSESTEKSAVEKKALLTRLDEYQEQVGDLDAMRNKLKEHDFLKAKMSQAGEFEDRMVKALEERDQAKENLQTLATAVEQMRSQRKVVNTELASMQVQSEAANNRIKLLTTEQSQAAEMRQQLDQAQSTLLQQKTELERQKRLNNELAAAVDSDKRAKTELLTVTEKASSEIAQQKKVNTGLTEALETATKDRNTLVQQVETQNALLSRLKAQVNSPEATQRMSVLQEENARLSNELQSLEAKLIQSELKVQDLVVQQQEVLVRLKRLLSAANE